MTLKKFTVLSIIVFSLITVAQVRAQTNPIFLQLGQAKGALYEPDPGPSRMLGLWLCIANQIT